MLQNFLKLPNPLTPTLSPAGRGSAPYLRGRLELKRCRRGRCVMAILDVEDIHTYYGDAYVLQGLSLTLEQGQILGLLGRNGVGKTTLVNSIVGFVPPRRGRITFKGRDITGHSSFAIVRSGMGLVPQGRRVFPTLSVEDNLLVAEHSPERHGWSLERVFALFPRLRERRRQRAKTLSGGEQQMLAIGRGLMTNPDCLIMDEPSEGLAPIIIQGLWEAIAKLKQEGLSILLVEQNAALALKLVDFVHVMSKGRVVYSAPPGALWDNQEIKARYLGI
jgi:branched-chain amino acid transport system ATP-binding protein